MNKQMPDETTVLNALVAAHGAADADLNTLLDTVLPDDLADPDEAEWFRRLWRAAKAADAELREKLRQRYERALVSGLVRLAIEKGDAIDQGRLGTDFLNGDGVPQDYAAALRLLRFSAESGNANGQRELGLMYQTGRGVTADDAEAERWLRLAADQGDAKSQVELGAKMSNKAERNKANGAQDWAEAERLYRLAADQGNADGQFMLGCVYLFGEGVEKERAEAERWFRAAAEQGDTTAQDVLGRFYANTADRLKRPRSRSAKPKKGS